MSLDTRAGLKAEIADILDRDDLTAQIDTFIQLAEARHKREIRIREMVQREQATINDRYEVLPNGFLQMRELRLTTTPICTLEYVNPHELQRRRQTTSGRPRHYTVHEEIEFDRTPDTEYTAEMIFWKAFTPLSEDNPTNALLTRAPDAYFWAALAASAPWLMHDERIGTWDGAYASVRDALNAADRKSQTGGPLISRVYGATP